jgi:glycine/serine hydroxymethyltransferase
MKEGEMRQIAAWMDQIVNAPEDESLATKVRAEVRDFCTKFPAPGL